MEATAAKILVHFQLRASNELEFSQKVKKHSQRLMRENQIEDVHQLLSNLYSRGFLTMIATEIAKSVLKPAILTAESRMCMQGEEGSGGISTFLAEFCAKSTALENRFFYEDTNFPIAKPVRFQSLNNFRQMFICRSAMTSFSKHRQKLKLQHQV